MAPPDKVKILWSGGRYEGEAKDIGGSLYPHGFGVLYANHRTFEGVFVNGRKSRGKVFCTDGNTVKYEGTLDANGRAHGYGVRYNFDHLHSFRYEGGFAKDEPHGQGRFFMDGTISYDGEWKKGYRWGRGSLYENGYLYYSGDWVRDSMCGHGTIYWRKSEMPWYVGEVKNGQPNGQGTSYFSDGAVEYTGSFKDGMWHGKGLENKGRFQVDGIWANGKLVSQSI